MPRPNSKQLSRIAVARRLMALALRIAAGKRIAFVGGAIKVPEGATLRIEHELGEDEHELDIELHWDAEKKPARRPAARRAAKPGRRRAR